MGMFIIPGSAAAQSAEIQQLVLNIEKLSQFKKILSDMKKGYELLSAGYKSVKDMSQGNYSLHKTFLDALMRVSPVVKNYKKVGDIVHFQTQLLRESRSAMEGFTRSGSFSSQELEYFQKVNENLLQQSARNLDELTMVMTDGKLRMSDDERLQSIDAIYAQIKSKLLFLRSFNASSGVLALQRAKELKELYTASEIQGIKN